MATISELRDLMHNDYKVNGFWHALEIHDTLEDIIKNGSNDFQPVLDKLNT